MECACSSVLPIVTFGRESVGSVPALTAASRAAVVAALPSYSRTDAVAFSTFPFDEQFTNRHKVSVSA